MEVGDVSQMDLNGRYALRVSVSPLTYRSHVAEGLQVWQTLTCRERWTCSSVQMTLKRKQQWECSLRFILRKKAMMMNGKNNGQIHGKHDAGASREFTI